MRSIVSRLPNIFLACIAVHYAAATATVRRVPTDYPTIQAALNCIESGDTVLATPGTYHEALTTPPGVDFALHGDVEPDSGDYLRPIIDPTPLEHPNQLACLTVNVTGSAVVQDFEFYNGAAMHSRDDASVGGVFSYANRATYRRCVFDSTHVGLHPGGHRVIIEDCIFEDNVGACLSSQGLARLELYRSSFHTRRGMMMWVRDSAVVEDCWFRERSDVGEWIWMIGSGIVVRGCQFGPSTIRSPQPIFTADLRGLQFESNLFTSLVVGGSCIQLNCVCDSPDTNRILGNRFINNRVQQGQGGGGMRVQCEGITDGFAAIIRENVFDSCGTTGFFRALLVSDNAHLWRNRFSGPSNNNIPAVMIADGWEFIVRDNLFQGSGYALAAGAEIPIVDASSNWWGHASGPYHADFNPGGQGDRVGDNINFEPWRTDTLFLDVRVDQALLPSELQLSVFPNPFNATARITLLAPPGEYAVDLFNTLGQRVRELWRGSSSVERTISFDGSDLPTGIYFVRASSTIGNRSPAVEKIVLLK